MKEFILIFLVLAAFTCFYSHSDAYVLQGPHLLELMTKKLGGAKRLLIFQKLVIYNNGYNNGSQSDTVELNETLRYAFPEKFRSDIDSENVQIIYVVSSDTTLTIIDGEVVSSSSALPEQANEWMKSERMKSGEHDSLWRSGLSTLPENKPEKYFNRYKDILLYRSRILLQKRLLFLGVDISVSSLGRFQGKTAYILGAQYPDESVPQVWIDKNTFLPFRWVINGGDSESNKDLLEIRYLEWKRVEKTWYPMRIEFYQNNILMRETNVDHIKMNPFFSEDFFDIDHLESIHSQTASVPSDQHKSDGLDEVRKTIEDFKKIYE